MNNLEYFNPLLHSQKDWVKLGIISALNFLSSFVKLLRPEVFNIGKVFNYQIQPFEDIIRLVRVSISS